MQYKLQGSQDSHIWYVELCTKEIIFHCFLNLEQLKHSL